MFDRVDGQFDVQVGPVKMVWLGPVESEDCLDRSALEPRVLIEGQEQLPLVEQQPEAVPVSPRVNYKSSYIGQKRVAFQTPARNGDSLSARDSPLK
jgi:hypothetical protein